MGMIRDYRGQSYDSDTLLNLSRQLAPHIGSLQGGVYGLGSGQNIGFDYDVAKQLLGTDPSRQDQVLLDMSRYLMDYGVTDFSQITPEQMYMDTQVQRDDIGNYWLYGQTDGADGTTGPRTQLTPEQAANVSMRQRLVEGSGSGENYTAPYSLDEYFWNAPGGYKFNGPNGAIGHQFPNWLNNDYMNGLFGETYAGDGATHYQLVRNADGTISINTKGNSTSDFGKDDLMGVLSVLAVAFGVPELAGEWAAAGGAGNAGYGIVGGATEPVASLGLGGGTSASGALGTLGTLETMALPAELSASAMPTELSLSGAGSVGASTGALDLGGAGGGSGYGLSETVASGTGNGAFLGEGVASGVPAWDAAAKAAGLSISPSILSTAANLLGKAVKDLSLSDILKVAGGISDKNNQGDAADKLITYLKERQGINDKMYAPGSDEYNALWNEMSRKDAAAGRNSQYGPRSVDLAARIAQIKMDANTRMTTGIGSLFRDAFDQEAGADTGLITALGSILGDKKGGLNFTLGDIGTWLDGLFKD